MLNKTLNRSNAYSRTDYLASQDDNDLEKCVANNKEGLAYLGHAYYKNNANKLKITKIFNPKDQAVMPLFKSIQNEHYRPLSRPLFFPSMTISYEPTKRSASSSAVT